MAQNSYDKRNFLFFLNEVHPLNTTDALMGALIAPSSWDAVAGMVNSARQKDAFVRSIKRLQLYVHVPFCARICTFCCCAKVLLQQRSEIDAYIRVLTRQMMFFAPVYKGMDTPSIFFGGGTPSILDEEQLTGILDVADKAFPAQGRKIFFEAHPSSWTASKLALLSSRGLYRLSLGIQSLEEKVLKQVSRTQNREKVMWCLNSARKAGIPQVSVDFVAGLPGQTVKGIIKDIKVVIEEGANVVSVEPYHKIMQDRQDPVLSMKQMCGPGESIPAFFKRREDIMKAALQTLQEAGFYSNGPFRVFMREKGSDGRHEVEAYMHLEEAMAGFGPFARGQFPGVFYYRAGGFKPTENFPEVRACEQDFSSVMAHYAVFALIHGLDEQVFLKRFGVSLDQHCAEGLRYLQESGLVAYSKGTWKFSGKWEIRRLYEFSALSRVLFNDGILSRLRARYAKEYDPGHDYSRGGSLLKAYAVNWIMNSYYRLGY